VRVRWTLVPGLITQCCNLTLVEDNSNNVLLVVKRSNMKDV